MTLLLVFLACASTPPDPFLGQDIQLRLGVDPKDETQAVQVSFEQAGYRLAKRIDGRLFTALAFDDPNGRPRAVRVVTTRGIALALDTVEASALSAAMSYRLLDATRPQAAKNSAHAEGLLILEIRGEEQCVRPYQVSANGIVLGQDLDLPAQGASVCAQEVEDRDGDGRAELLAEYRVEGLPLPVVPEVRTLLFADGEGHYSKSGPQAAITAYYAAETAQRQEALKQSVAQHSEVEVYRLAVELALVAHLQGQDAAAQRALLSQAFESLPKEERQADWEKAIMARVDEGW